MEWKEILKSWKSPSEAHVVKKLSMLQGQKELTRFWVNNRWCWTKLSFESYAFERFYALDYRPLILRAASPFDQTDLRQLKQDILSLLRKMPIKCSSSTRWGQLEFQIKVNGELFCLILNQHTLQQLIHKDSWDPDQDWLRLKSIISNPGVTPFIKLYFSLTVCYQLGNKFRLCKI